MTKYIATFRPQAWVNGYSEAVDPEGVDTWDCTDYAKARFSPERIEEMLVETFGTWDHDDLIQDPKAPDWVRNWDGPFEVRFTKQEER